jgi:ribulose-phosphate 3-epimerase
MKIIPAILPEAFPVIERAVEQITEAASTVQIDFVDGFFAPNRTWFFNRKDESHLEQIRAEEIGMPHWEDINYELDLMVNNPLDRMDDFIALAPSKIIFHVEAFPAKEDEEKLINYFETLPEMVRAMIGFGMALGNDTDPALLAAYIPYIKSIQCMGIAQVGSQGQPFDPRVFDQIKKVKALYPGMIITVDGAVSLDNAVALAEAGVTQLIIGSAIFQSPDPRGTIGEFKHLCRKQTSQPEN